MNLQMVRDVQTQIRPWTIVSPLLRSVFFSDILRRDVFLKLETLQPTGSFKVRPAFAGILANLDVAQKQGVIASSSGNFAQAVAYAAKQLGVSATIVMTSNSALHKIEATRALGAEVVLTEPNFDARWSKTHEIQSKTGRLLLHPYDSAETIAGDASIALEICEQMNDTAAFAVFTPSSGGGLLAGISWTIKSTHPQCTVFGAQPELNGALLASLVSGRPATVAPKGVSIADALVATKPGERAFELIKSNVEDVFLVSEEELREVTLKMMNQQKLIAEPGGVAGLAAALKHSARLPTTMPIVCVISGANIAPVSLP